MAKGPFNTVRCEGALHSKSCASISRVLYPPCGEPPPSIWSRRHQRDPSTYPPVPEMHREDGLSSFRRYGTPGIHGLSAREVYQAALSPEALVRSYRTFSSLPRQVVAVSLSAALSVDHPFPSGPLPVRKHAALRCPDFPPCTLRCRTVERCTRCQRTFNDEGSPPPLLPPHNATCRHRGTGRSRSTVTPSSPLRATPLPLHRGSRSVCACHRG